MQALVSLIVGVLVGAGLGVIWSRAAKSDGKASWSDQTFRGWGSVALIPGGGWQAVVFAYRESESEQVLKTGVPPAVRVERLPVIGWELFQRLDSEDLKLEEKTIVTKVHREQMRAHCMDAGQRAIWVLSPNDDLLIQFLAPGQQTSDEDLLRRANELSKENAKRDWRSLETT